MTRLHESLGSRDFKEFFRDATNISEAYEWQVRVAMEGLPEVLPIPTGLGKTEGAVLAWAWRKLFAGLDEPLHLVYCLPMRSLVSQTVERLDRYFGAIAAKRNLPQVAVYQLMGGAIDEGWARNPDEPWVLVGTQDQLLSRALNRGYAMSRFEWPMHFGLLNQDCRWIVDEVQLMGPGLWTTSQLDWMRRKRFPAIKPCRTTWMSATVADGFLATTDRKQDGLDKFEPFDPKLNEDKNEELRRRLSAIRQVKWFSPSTGKRAPSLQAQIATSVDREHRTGTLSLVICNTVRDAQDLFKALPDRLPKILLTSRFRRNDRLRYEQQLLDFESQRGRSKSGEVASGPGLVCVSTQVVEAGLDISAHRLWSQLAPWASIVQRLGRLNRDGRCRDACAYLWQVPKDQEQKRDGEIWVGPYNKRDLDSSTTLLRALAPLSLEAPISTAISTLARDHGKLLDSVLQPKPSPLPRALDVHGLFSTESDLHGGFTDVSSFVRGPDPNADLTVVWRTWAGHNPPRAEARAGPPLDTATEGCPVAVHRLRDLLGKKKARAWIWNDQQERWETVSATDLRPGMIVMLHRDAGGYDVKTGWTGDPADVLSSVLPVGPGRSLAGDERSELGSWVALQIHLDDAHAAAENISDKLQLPNALRLAVVEAAKLHDIGKAHPRWQGAVPSTAGLQGGPWAKFPVVVGVDLRSSNLDVCAAIARLRPAALPLPETTSRRGVRLRWIVDRKLTREELEVLTALLPVIWAGHVPFRPGMRHEAASALAMWARYREGQASYPALSAYLVAAHHGKVRTVLRSTNSSGDDVFGIGKLPDALELNGGAWPLDFSVAADGASGEWRDTEFDLSGYGWTGLVADLLGPWRDHNADRSDVGAVPESEPRRLGPFVLAWLEALVRVADWRASANPSKEIRLPEVHSGT